MNRYALFFVLISLSAPNILLHATEEDARNEKLKSKINSILEGRIDINVKLSDELKRIFNILVPEKGLNAKECKTASALERVCVDDMLKHFDYAQLDKEWIETIVKNHVKKFIAQIAQVKVERELEKKLFISAKIEELKPDLDKAHQLGEFLDFKDVKELFIKIVHDEVFHGRRSTTCSYIVHEKKFEQHLSDLIDDMSDMLTDKISKGKKDNFINKERVMSELDRFDKLVFGEWLNSDQHKAAVTLKHECNEKMLKRLNEETTMYFNNRSARRDMYNQLESCILEFVKKKAKNEYEKYTTESLGEMQIDKIDDEKIKEEVVLQAAGEAYNKIENGSPQNLTYLFDGSFERRLHNQIHYLFKKHQEKLSLFNREIPIKVQKTNLVEYLERQQ